jgi:xylose isomerase
VWQLDQFPFREDSVEAANLAISFLKRVHGALARLDATALLEAQRNHDAIAAHRLVQAALFG